MNEELITSPEEKRIKSLWVEIDNYLADCGSEKLDIPAQIQLGKLLNLLKPMKRFELNKNGYTHYENVLILQLFITAMNAILCKSPNLILAMESRRELKDIVDKRGGFLRWFHSTQASLKVLFGLIVALVVIFSLKMAHSYFATPIDGINQTHLSLAIFFGAMGSIVSIMIRLNEFYNSPDGSTSYLFLLGCFKPFIGVIFALFICATLWSGIIPVDQTREKFLASIIVVSFLAGFSERFAKDAASKAEGHFIK